LILAQEIVGSNPTAPAKKSLAAKAAGLFFVCAFDSNLIWFVRSFSDGIAACRVILPPQPRKVWQQKLLAFLYFRHIICTVGMLK
jgi:hypothetical protein